MEHCKGLEHLMVLCIGLDAPIHLEADAMVTRAQIYQALTRAQLHAIVINEYVEKGWLEFLGLVKFSELERFEESRALAETEANAAANTLVELQHPVPESLQLSHRIPGLQWNRRMRLQCNQSNPSTKPPIPSEPPRQSKPPWQSKPCRKAGLNQKLCWTQPGQAKMCPGRAKMCPDRAKQMFRMASYQRGRVAVMATSVWDTGDNDDRIAERIKELLFDPREKAGCGKCRGFWNQASAGKENFVDARSKPIFPLSHTAQTLSKFSCVCFIAW